MQFGVGGEFEHPLRVRSRSREDPANFEAAFGQRSGLVEGDRPDRAQRLKVTAPLEQDAATRRAADSGEERKRH
ncbi:hypothetical protein SDC9_211513 [bioreactor metagenome]|uniref:Uncharacterized protein n=1 Tax=bioreactor metagenome TaxID=1076179 RepID=A0A645JK58_9ZZZZ